VFETDYENIFKIFYSFITQKEKSFYLTCFLEIYNTKKWFSGGGPSFTGVTEVKTDRQNSKVTVIGKADKSQVLKKAKKFDCRAKILEVKKAEVAEKKVEEKKKEEHPKKKEEPNTTWTNDPRNFYPTYCLPYCYPYPYPAPPFEADGTYRPSQAYPPHYYPYLETDYSYYNYPNNPHYLTHIRYSWAAITITQNNPHYLTYIKHSWAFLFIIMFHTSVQISTSLILLHLILIRKESESSPPCN